MKKTLALLIAPPLLVLKSIAIFYAVFLGDMAPRYQRNTGILGGIFTGLAVLLYIKPRIGRWPVGVYYFFATWLALGAIVKPGAAPRDVVIGLVSLPLACWLAYALLGSEKMKGYMADQVSHSERP